MRQRVEGTITKIREDGNDWINILNSCSGLKERYKKLLELLPETSAWPCIVRRELVFQLHWVFKVDFGVCEYYSVDDYRQYCWHDGVKQECLCYMPQPFCILRDRDGQPKYPELMPASTRSK